MKLLKPIAVLILIVAAAWLGAVWGGARSGPQYAALFAPSDAAGAVIVLRLLRRDETERAIDLLEQTVDFSMERASFYDPNLDWLLLLAGEDANLRDTRLKMIEYVSNYKEQFPYKTKLEERSEAFKSILGKP